MDKVQLRPSDLLGRIGGEEFLLLLPDTALADGVRIVERLRYAMDKTMTLPDWPELSCTFSVGLTETGPSDSVASLFHRADQALYAAKQGGRDRQVAISS